MVEAQIHVDNLPFVIYIYIYIYIYALDPSGPESNEPMVNPLFLVIAIKREVCAFSLEERSSKPLHSNENDEESNSSS